MDKRSLCSAMAVALLLAGAGCGGNKPVPVRGTVTLDGQPIEGAMVLFLPEEAGGRQATGQTGPGGKFELTTARKSDGALPGNYKVVVQYTEGVVAPPSKNMREAFGGLEKAREKGKAGAARHVIPPRFSEPGKTELRQKVPAGGEVQLDLKSK